MPMPPPAQRPSIAVADRHAFILPARRTGHEAIGHRSVTDRGHTGARAAGLPVHATGAEPSWDGADAGGPGAAAIDGLSGFAAWLGMPWR